jgi:hypothetical protein
MFNCAHPLHGHRRVDGVSSRLPTSTLMGGIWRSEISLLQALGRGLCPVPETHRRPDHRRRKQRKGS